MTTIHQRHQIVESISGLDSAQAEKVLMYIKGLVQDPKSETEHEKMKKAALKEIRRALSVTRHMPPSA